MTAPKVKTIETVEQFLHRGGKITQIGCGVSGANSLKLNKHINIGKAPAKHPKYVTNTTV